MNEKLREKEILKVIKVEETELKEKIPEVIVRTEEEERNYQEIIERIPLTPTNIDKFLKYHRTDSGNAELFRDFFGNLFRYVPETGHWFYFNGVYWEQADEKAVLYMLSIQRKRIDFANSKLFPTLLPINGQDSTREELIKFSLRSESSFKIKAALSIAQCMLVQHYADFDKDHYLLCCENGVIDLRTGKFRKARPEDYLHKCTHITYDAEADCPRWHRFLEEIFLDDEEMIHFNQKAVGYSLTGETSAQCIFLLHGGGQNGKSTYLDVLFKLLGDFAYSVSMNMFKEQKNENNIPNDIAGLCGKRFVKATESKEGSKMNEERVKLLTGDDAISARFLHQEFFDFDPTHKIWLAVNHLPQIRGTDEGIWRRIKRIPFEASFPEGKRDENLKKKLLEELPGILNWSITGCILWQDERLLAPGKVKEATQAYREESDIIGSFLSECTITNENAKVKAGDLWEAYERFCGGKGDIKQTTFGLRIRERGFERKSMKGYPYYHGIGLKE